VPAYDVNGIRMGQHLLLHPFMRIAHRVSMSWS
jgi:hypothetical protein